MGVFRLCLAFAWFDYESKLDSLRFQTPPRSLPPSVMGKLKETFYHEI